MDHVDAVLKRDVDDSVLCEVRANGREALPNLVRFIRLESIQKFFQIRDVLRTEPPGDCRAKWPLASLTF